MTKTTEAFSSNTTESPPSFSLLYSYQYVRGPTSGKLPSKYWANTSRFYALDTPHYSFSILNICPAIYFIGQNQGRGIFCEETKRVALPSIFAEDQANWQLPFSYFFDNLFQLIIN
jgi:hypothetical protein